MAHKEYNVLEIVDVLRRYLAGDSIRSISRSTGMDRNTTSFEEAAATLPLPSFNESAKKPSARRVR